MGNVVAFLREPQTTLGGRIGNYREDWVSSPLGHTYHPIAYSGYKMILNLFGQNSP